MELVATEAVVEIVALVAPWVLVAHEVLEVLAVLVWLLVAVMAQVVNVLLSVRQLRLVV